MRRADESTRLRSHLRRDPLVRAEKALDDAHEKVMKAIGIYAAARREHKAHKARMVSFEVVLGGKIPVKEAGRMPRAYEIPEEIVLNPGNQSIAFNEPAVIDNEAIEVCPEHFDTSKRLFVLLHNDTVPGREHNIVQAHFETGVRKEAGTSDVCHAVAPIRSP